MLDSPRTNFVNCSEPVSPRPAAGNSGFTLGCTLIGLACLSQGVMSELMSSETGGDKSPRTQLATPVYTLLSF
jgi:hypothetical protein